jgi:hypothetical protein
MASNLNALAAIVEKLMQKNGADFTWDQDTRGFKADLAETTSARSLDDLLRVSEAISRIVMLMCADS